MNGYTYRGGNSVILIFIVPLRSTLKGENLLLQVHFLSFKNTFYPYLLWKDFIDQGKEQEVTKVVSLDKNR